VAGATVSPTARERAALPRSGPEPRLAPVAPTAAAGASQARSPRSVRPGRHRLRVQWLLLAAALTVLAGVLVAWALDRAAGRVQVVTVARPVAAGSVISAADLGLTSIAFDTPVTGLAPASSLELLVGRVATVDLEPGMLLSTGMWADGTELSPDERTIGALLQRGAHPAGLAAGAGVQAVDLTDTTAAPVFARVLEADADEQGGLHVTLAVPAAEAARLARLAAIDQLVIVGVPAETPAPDVAVAAGVPPAAVTGDPSPVAAPAPAETSTPGDRIAGRVFDAGWVTP
jgi:hypothetical protein